MPALPVRPNLDHLRHQARDLLRAADAGDTRAADRIRSVSGQLTLTGAQLAVARGYGFASWPAPPPRTSRCRPKTPNPPSGDVAELLRGYGIADGQHGAQE
jgi:hypothetical protein